MAPQIITNMKRYLQKNEYEYYEGDSGIIMMSTVSVGHFNMFIGNDYLSYKLPLNLKLFIKLVRLYENK